VWSRGNGVKSGVVWGSPGVRSRVAQVWSRGNLGVKSRITQVRGPG
jgi:hypothetical protein